MKKVKAVTGAATWSILVDEVFMRSVALRTSGNIQRLRLKAGLTELIMEKGKAVAVDDVQKDTVFNKEADGFRTIIIRSMICAPLKVGDIVVGVARLINKKNGKLFTDAEVKLLSDTSFCAGLVLERTSLYMKLEEVSMTDELTGLYNIRFLNRSIDIEIERSNRYGSLFSVIFMDIDNLKKVNEKFGHLAGSRVLIETARLLEDNLRKVDMIIKYGGDEFVIILPQTPRDGGFLVAERLRKTIEKNIFMKAEGYAVRITASFGVASYPDNAKNKEDLLKIADKAMFSGKLSTKNVVFAAK